MSNSSFSSHTLLSARNVVEEISTSAGHFLVAAEQENCTLLIDIPDNITVSMVSYGSPADVFITDILELTRLHESRRPVPVDPEIDFLCLNASEAQKLSHRETIKQKQFEAVARMCDSGCLKIIDIDSYQTHFPGNTFDLSAYSEFATYESNQQTTYQSRTDRNRTQTATPVQKSIPITFEDLLIRNIDAKKIAFRLQPPERQFGKFRTHKAISPMLLDLNEASTFFFSQSEHAEIDKIQEWFRKRWGHQSVGKDVIEQAAYAIIPDDLYPKSPRKFIPEETKEKYNSYASSTLILINEYAFNCWEKINSQSPIRPFPKRNTIIDELKDKDFSAKMSGAVSTIIRLR